MEDRVSAGLYLELGNVSAAAYRERAQALLGTRGVQRVTWWENSVPGRTELPMRVPDGTLLGVAEVDDTFVANDRLADATALHFRRHPRPSQGILTAKPTTGLLVVWISPYTPDLAQPLRDWADFVHIRHIAAAGVPGFTQISVYENVEENDPKYMHFYEMDAEDPEAAYQGMAQAVAPTIGGYKSAPFAGWADWKAAGGRLLYCNTFRRLGSLEPS